MIDLYKADHYCQISIYEDLFGQWHVIRNSGKKGKPGTWIKIFKFEDKLEADLKYVDLEFTKRQQGFNYI